MTCKRIVELGARAYPIHIGPDLLPKLGAHCAEEKMGSKTLIVSDDHVDALYGGVAEESLRSVGLVTARVTVPAGEPSKSHDPLIRIYHAALDAGLERSSSIVALGGGVVGDLAGFAAATYLRGIRLIQVPTSLLAMVDSAVGGKTGINLPQGKNLIGAFYQPSMVLADTATLRTLPPREFCAGLAEVVKYGVIADAGLFDALEGKTPEILMNDDALLEDIICRSCEIKADVVRDDEREGGVRAILNFGHTLGHAIEQVSGYGRYLHGEAIAMGMVYAARLSERELAFPAKDTERLIRLLKALRLPVTMPDLSWPALMKAMRHDKKKTGGTVGFVLAQSLGAVRFGCALPETLLNEVWEQNRDTGESRAP